jgi:hypothetical protein
VDIVEQESDLLSPFTLDGARKKAIVPVKLPFVMILESHPNSAAANCRGNRAVDEDMTW